MFKDLSESKCSHTHVQKDPEMSVVFADIPSTTTCTPRKFMNHMQAKPLKDSIFHIEKIDDFESSKD